jgi:hypothetical protein
MTIKAWPFLVSCNPHLEYRTIFARNFICQAKLTQLLADAADGDLTDERVAIYREIHHSEVGDIASVFLVVRAMAKEIGLEGDERQKDLFGRQVYLIEGIVLRGSTPGIVVTNDDRSKVHELPIRHYRDFWNCTGPRPAIPSEAVTLGAEASLGIPLELRSIRPFTVENDRGKTWDEKYSIKAGFPRANRLG